MASGKSNPPSAGVKALPHSARMVIKQNEAGRKGGNSESDRESQPSSLLMNSESEPSRELSLMLEVAYAEYWLQTKVTELGREFHSLLKR